MPLGQILQYNTKQEEAVVLSELLEFLATAGGGRNKRLGEKLLQTKEKYANNKKNTNFSINMTVKKLGHRSFVPCIAS